jgi:anti-sigma factor (TIGR02949 family)
MTETVDCAAVMLKLYEFLDDEIEPGDKAEFERHMQSCVTCFEAFDFEAELRDVIRAKLAQDVTCPSSLRGRILEALDKADAQGDRG